MRLSLAFAAAVLACAAARAQQSPQTLPPALFVRYPVGPGGYTPERLSQNVDLTRKNLNALTDYLQPWREGVRPPTGADAEWAKKQLVSEGAAADELIRAIDELFAKGIARAPASEFQLPPLGYPSHPRLRRERPTIEQLQIDVAITQMNVLGHSRALIESRQISYQGYAEQEAKWESWLEEARRALADTRRSIGAAERR